jgi:hypothetical protein
LIQQNICQRKSCKSLSMKTIVYDCGVEKQTIELCDTCYHSDPIFQRHIVSVEELDNDGRT